MVMPAATYDLLIEQGATYRRTFTWRQGEADGEPYDLTGCTARMQIRPKAGLGVALALTTENGGILLGEATGQIDVFMSADETDALGATLLRGVYDLEIVYPSGDVTRVVQGKVRVSANVTRDV